MDGRRGGRWPWIQGQDSLCLPDKIVQGESQLESHPHRAGRPCRGEPLSDRACHLQYVVGPHQANCGQRPREALLGSPSSPEPGRITQKLGGHAPTPGSSPPDTLAFLGGLSFSPGGTLRS